MMLRELPLLPLLLPPLLLLLPLPLTVRFVGVKVDVDIRGVTVRSDDKVVIWFDGSKVEITDLIFPVRGSGLVSSSMMARVRITSSGSSDGPGAEGLICN